jgi:hypothetical protein
MDVANLANLTTLADLIPSTIKPQQWGVIALAGATIIYAVFIRPAMKQKKDPLARTPSQTRLSQQRAVERQMENLLVELSEMARQITAQLDTRAAKLELLIKEADEKLTALKSATQASAGLNGGNDEAVISAQKLPVADVLAGRGLAAESFNRPRVDPRHAAIYRMSDEGRSPREIARELGQPNGEVELILAIRQRES